MDLNTRNGGMSAGRLRVELSRSAGEEAEIYLHKHAAKSPAKPSQCPVL